LAYEISNGLVAGVNISYDEAFDTRVSADIKVRFGSVSKSAQCKEVHENSVIKALTLSPGNRVVRVHDDACSDLFGSNIELPKIPIGPFIPFTFFLKT
jgi:hypothetical protein